MKRSIKKILALLSVLMVPGFAVQAASHMEEGGVMTEDAALAVVTIVAVDKDTRTLTLKGEDGKEWTFTAGPEVRNFDQIRRGDRVIIEYFQGFALALGPKGSGTRGRLDTLEMERAKRGEKPAGRVTRRVEVTARVKAVNKKGRTVTLLGPMRTLVLGVSNDVDLSRVEVGQDVEAVYIESYAVSVVPAPKVSGTVTIDTTSVAVVVGIQWGQGTLTMNDGSTHPFKVTGLSVLDVGVSKIEAAGEVFHLVEAKDLAGTYVAGEAGAALVGGGSAIAMKNEHGVVMQLESKQKGVKLTLAAQGLKVTLK